MQISRLTSRQLFDEANVMPSHLNCNLNAFLVASLARTHLAKKTFCSSQLPTTILWAIILQQKKTYSWICCIVALALLPVGWETFLPGHLHPWLLVIWLAPSFGLVLIFCQERFIFCLFDWSKDILLHLHSWLLVTWLSAPPCWA